VGRAYPVAKTAVVLRRVPTGRRLALPAEDRALPALASVGAFLASYEATQMLLDLLAKVVG
jgi:hypothetical protein